MPIRNIADIEEYGHKFEILKELDTHYVPPPSVIRNENNGSSQVEASRELSQAMSPRLNIDQKPEISPVAGTLKSIGKSASRGNR